jgi:hypothetical protein
MAATKIMVIRHAEKPTDDGTIAGVSLDGTQNEEELIVKGWQRSGALVRFFKPVDGRFACGELETPNVIFASAVARKSKSLRPQHTVLSLADFLGLPLDLNHTKGDEDALVADALARNGVVLIAWEHEAIPGIANRILGDTTTCPQKWPDDQFDLVWVFDRRTGEQGWNFNQVPQMLLPGDRNDVVPQT